MTADDKERVAPKVREIAIEDADETKDGAVCGSVPEDAAADAAAQDAQERVVAAGRRFPAG